MKECLLEKLNESIKQGAFQIDFSAKKDPKKCADDLGKELRQRGYDPLLIANGKGKKDIYNVYLRKGEVKNA